MSDDSQFQQTWWDKNLPTRFNEFQSWVGPSTEPSKVYFRNFVKEHGYKSLLDLGCGNATEHFAYQSEYPELEYTGVDSSEYLNKMNTSKGVKMIKSDITNVPLPDSSVDVAFSRHVLEHQPDFKPALSEIIRLGKHVSIHIFFISPSEKDQIINYSPQENLYHNTYVKSDIENYVNTFDSVERFEWVKITASETAMIVYKKKGS